MANLAQLKLSEKEVKKFQKQLSDILDYIAQLQKLDTQNIKPTSQTTGMENVFREDAIGPGLTQKEALSGAKKKRNGYFQTKGVLNV